MTAFPELTVLDLADFSGRPEASYPTTTSTALTQSLLLFKISTCLTALPDDALSLELARMAILSYADYIVLSRPFSKAVASPFSSESLGSYSYSKAALSASRGEKTNIMWFDLAVERMGQCGYGDDIPEFGGIEIFEHDAAFVAGSTPGAFRMLSPQDQQQSAAFGLDPAEY